MTRLMLVVGFCTLTLTCVLCQNLVHESEHEIVYRVVRDARDARGARNRASGSECRYKKGPWIECDGATNTQSRSLTLKRGDASCEQTKLITKKCKRACRYEKGEWSECDGVPSVRTRIDKLKAKSDAGCENPKQITKPCKNVAAGGSVACRYERNTSWTNCEGGKKSKVLRLMAGSPSNCPPTKNLEKNCRKGRPGKNGSDEE